MSAIFGERLIFGQHNGPDIELRVFGKPAFSYLMPVIICSEHTRPLIILIWPISGRKNYRDPRTSDSPT